MIRAQLFSLSVSISLLLAIEWNSVSASAALFPPTIPRENHVHTFEDFETEAVVIQAIPDNTEDLRETELHRRSPVTRNAKQFFSYFPLFAAETYQIPKYENEVLTPSLLPSASSADQHSYGDSTCVTNQGRRGNCDSFESCFPLLNLPEEKFGNETSNHSNLQDELYELSSNAKCSSVVHAGTSKYSNVCCDKLQNEEHVIPQAYNSPLMEEEVAANNTPPRYTKVVNTWATCGEKQFDFKIIGGQETIPHEYPWMVSLWGKSGKHICGAALLDNNYVLTAAHCISRYTPQDVGKIRLHVGDHNIHSTVDGHHEIRSVSKIIKHKRFSLQTFVNDIALVKFDRPVPYTDRIRPICLPSGMKRTDSDPYLLVAGWGQTMYKGTSSSVLRKVLVPGVPSDSCSVHYNTISPAGVTPDMLCAGGSGVDSCIGDSGGPLVQLVDNRYEQVGIVSFGRECGTYPGVYTKVHSYLKWINVNRNKY